MRNISVIICLVLIGCLPSVFSKQLDEFKDKAYNQITDTYNDKLIFRSYKLNDELADIIILSEDKRNDYSVNVENFFKGISFNNNESAIFMPKFNTLIVNHTSKNISRIENLLSEYQEEQLNIKNEQVEIKVKILEVSQKAFDELGFNWNFVQNKNGNTSLDLGEGLSLNSGQDLFSSGLRTASAAIGNPVSGVLSLAKSTGDFQWNAVINALEKQSDTDVLSSPKVVVLDGSTATIQVGEERMIPKSFSINNQDTSPYVENDDWDLELMGVYLEVTPEIRENGLIDLELNPKVVDVAGYDNYSILPSYQHQYSIEYQGNAFIESIANPLNASLPYLRIRELETYVTVANGNTIAMGGLVYEKEEKFEDMVPILGNIPFLGKVFRSEGSVNVKRNLMIFVTATLVDSNGSLTSEESFHD